MDDQQIIVILVIIKVIILGLVCVASCLYAIPLIFIPRFHKPLHLLTLNVCVAAFCGIYFIMTTFYFDVLWTEASCLPIIFTQTTVVCQVLYALCMVSLNRLFIVVYKNKVFFQNKIWIAICISTQWIFVTLIALPTLRSSLWHCFISGLELNYQIYVLIIIGVIPAILLIITNGIIFISARKSTQRVQPMNGDRTTTSTFTQRDIRLLKHMVFIFAVFFCGWVPMFIIAVIDYNGDAIPYVVLHGLQILPCVALLIDIIDLFIYNHELRRYLTRQKHNELINIRTN
ncbi:unnamed protein product [Adineta steineri]|uniref:G-protein coupled receptors family 1 profile domain-containing protein n=1 Tax=Adineta steineri TaxID=433720 RepID=A0A814VBM2_9BILA|nr:unnamed protein product [Adineta steineri]CAF1624117.1 unnamed protein product [Adineta steineri]